ncbi:S8 family serine peptidase [Paractinoplanes toevensis]|uniref:S8 family serine peptidase n=1 Tax=Paractinoplanes toevensis TaxID=571911 RepID=UPI001FE8F892|nr:S8 family serine peptidase [Actinoplanes toevensis]
MADVDFGCRITHLDLAGAIEPDRVVNSFDGGTDVACGKDWDHGTGVLGLAGASANDLGMVGMAFGAALWVVQANDGRGPELPGNAWANGVDWVRTTSSGGRRKVVLVEVQNSGWNSEAMPALNAAIRHAIAAGSVSARRARASTT